MSSQAVGFALHVPVWSAAPQAASGAKWQYSDAGHATPPSPPHEVPEPFVPLEPPLLLVLAPLEPPLLGTPVDDVPEQATRTRTTPQQKKKRMGKAKHSLSCPSRSAR